MKIVRLFFLTLTIFMNVPSFAQLTGTVTADRFPNSNLLKELLDKNQAMLSPVIDNPGKFRLQVIYTQINRDKKNRPSFAHHFFNVSDAYNYPASTVKLPASVLALEYINQHKDAGLSKNTTMLTDAIRPGEMPVDNDTSNDGGKPSVANYIRKILLVSDNDAYNRLYELIGQESFNNRLHQLGFTDAQIIHRLEISLTEEQNRQTNPVRFVDAKGATLFEQPAQVSELKYATRNDKLGNGFMRAGQLVNEPLDFSIKNRWPLPYIHQLLQWIMFPESQPKGGGLKLTNEDYQFMRRYMSMMPTESQHPGYDPKEQWPSYVKFLYYGSEKNAAIQPDLRIFNKVGDAYGFLLDGAYFADFKNGVEFLLSAVLYCNEDGILNDNKYDYDSIGFPFMKQLGKVIYEYEVSRQRKHKPDLSAFRFDYSH